jgi:hypothetical protein
MQVTIKVFTGIHFTAVLGMCSYLHRSGQGVCDDDDDDYYYYYEDDEKEINTTKSYEDTHIQTQHNQQQKKLDL